jgi:ribosomal protein L1
MRTHGKKYTAAKGQVENKPYALADALPLVQKIKFANFDETVALSIRLGVDPKHADQMVRGTVVLPHGLGRSKKVLVIAGPDKQKEAEGGRRRSRRRRGTGREDQRRLAGLRRRRRHARHDARGRQAR